MSTPSPLWSSRRKYHPSKHTVVGTLVPLPDFGCLCANANQLRTGSTLHRLSTASSSTPDVGRSKTPQPYYGLNHPLNRDAILFLSLLSNPQLIGTHVRFTPSLWLSVPQKIARFAGCQGAYLLWQNTDASLFRTPPSIEQELQVLRWSHQLRLRDLAGLNGSLWHVVELYANIPYYPRSRSRRTYSLHKIRRLLHGRSVH
jgi:hypothetical protein